MTHSTEQGRPNVDDEGWPARFSFWPRKEIVAMNLAFAAAMLSARRRGLENFTIGPLVSYEPFVPKHFETAMVSSGLSSSSAYYDEDMSFGGVGARRAGRFA